MNELISPPVRFVTNTAIPSEVSDERVERLIVLISTTLIHDETSLCHRRVQVFSIIFSRNTSLDYTMTDAQTPALPAFLTLHTNFVERSTTLCLSASTSISVRAPGVNSFLRPFPRPRPRPRPPAQQQRKALTVIKQGHPSTITMRIPLVSEPPLNETSSPSSPTDESSAKRVIGDITDVRAEHGAVEISGKLKGAIQRLYAAHVTESGVDYAGMEKSQEFRDYQAAAALLPGLDVAKQLVTDDQKIAFYVNLYNAMTQHAIVSRGTPPGNSAARLLWSMRMTYDVGEYRLSVHDVENGVLRRNRRISVIPPPFGWFDSRKLLCVQNVDPRIHFVLNCAAASCPPVLFLTVDNLQRTLRIATEGFLSNSRNFRVDDDGRVLLSMIFKWYKTDFAPVGSDRALLSFVAQNVPSSNEFVPKLTRKLRETEAMQISPPIEWLPYDWSLNTM